MLCDSCKDKEASVHYQQIINNKMSEIHLCEKCASDKGMISFHTEHTAAFGNLLSGLMDDEAGSVSVKDGKVKLRCKCGWSDVDFRTTGYLGCSSCYNTFANSLSPLLRRIHGNNKHIGKKPAKVTVKEKFIEKEADAAAEKEFENAVKKKADKEADAENKVKKLKEDLARAIREERYEDAAKMRDELKKIEGKTGEQNV